MLGGCGTLFEAECSQWQHAGLARKMRMVPGSLFRMLEVIYEGSDRDNLCGPGTVRIYPTQPRVTHRHPFLHMCADVHGAQAASQLVVVPRPDGGAGSQFSIVSLIGAPAAADDDAPPPGRVRSAA